MLRGFYLRRHPTGQRQMSGYGAAAVKSRREIFPKAKLPVILFLPFVKGVAASQRATWVAKRIAKIS